MKWSIVMKTSEWVGNTSVKRKESTQHSLCVWLSTIDPLTVEFEINRCHIFEQLWGNLLIEFQRHCKFVILSVQQWKTSLSFTTRREGISARNEQTHSTTPLPYTKTAGTKCPIRDSYRELFAPSTHTANHILNYDNVNVFPRNNLLGVSRVHGIATIS